MGDVTQFSEYQARFASYAQTPLRDALQLIPSNDDKLVAVERIGYEIRRRADDHQYFPDLGIGIYIDGFVIAQQETDEGLETAIAEDAHATIIVSKGGSFIRRYDKKIATGSYDSTGQPVPNLVFIP